MSEIKEIHIGKHIKDVFKNSGMTVTKFADMIECQRPNIYDIFKRKSIDTELLKKISLVLNYNFIEEVYVKDRVFHETNPYFTNITFQIKSENFKEMEKVLKKLKKGGIIKF